MFKNYDLCPCVFKNVPPGLYPKCHPAGMEESWIGYSRVSDNCWAYNYCFLRFFLGLQPYMGAYIYWFLAFFQGLWLNRVSVEVLIEMKNWIRKVAIIKYFWNMAVQYWNYVNFLCVLLLLLSNFSDGQFRSHAYCVSTFPGPIIIWGPTFIVFSPFSRAYIYLRAYVY